MKTITDMLRERDEERRREAARRDAINFACLLLIAVLMAAASAFVAAFTLTALRLIEVAPTAAGLTP